MAEISHVEFCALAEFRYRIRSFLHFSEAAARNAGIQAQQHQALLVLKALEPEAASVGVLAERLQLRHHSAVELVDRLEEHGLVRRTRTAADRRSARLRLTKKGERILRELSVHHREELRSAIPALIESLAAIQRGAHAKKA